MFFILSKLLSFLLMPVGIILILLTLSILLKNRTKSKAVVLFTILLTYLFSCPFLVNKALRMWEYPQKSISAVENRTYGVVLTGGIANESLPYTENVNIDYAADRIWQALQLYKNKKITKILITGGDVGILHKKEVTEIDLAYNFLKANGVNKDDILLEKKARNTFENALHTNSRLQKRNIILITSAFHMRRAVGCFERQGFNVQPFPSHFMSRQSKTDLTDFFPNSGSFGISETLMKELVGTAIYKLNGYL
ncbi:YdcF family protein [Jiulongibacter sp. NS-SX5]|uniref:YdcF family protein n=1 Tax=Jiulongibacter sp. NS-SX5 TaxID=3463854 RepID=UPI004057DD60